MCAGPGGTSARAADLPMAKAVPVEYVRTCTVHGAGFFYIPGSDSCIRIAGRVRSDYAYYAPQNGFVPKATFSSNGTGVPPYSVYGTTFRPGRNVDATGFRVDGRLNLDIRTDTEWGFLRAYIRYEFRKVTGAFVSSTAVGGAQTDVQRLDLAYVQWAGITAGRVQSFWDFYTNEWNFQDLVGVSDTKVNSFAYTAKLGNGISATAGIEDSTDRFQAPRWMVPAALRSIDEGQAIYSPWFAPVDVGYGGTRMPNIVGNLRLDQSWGSAQLSGFITQTRFPALDSSFAGLGGYLGQNYGCTVVSGPGTCGLSEITADTNYGYGVQAGVKVNLPMLAAGDQIWLQAAYANGAVSYLQMRYGTLGASVAYTPDAWLTPRFNADGTFSGTVDADNVSGYSVAAVMLHYWTPGVRQALFGSYLKLDNPTSFAPSWNGGPQTAGYFYGAPDVTIWQVGSNVVWSPVKGLDVGAELGYISNDSGNRPLYLVSNGQTGAAQNASWVYSGTTGQFYTRLRLQREF